MNLLYPLTTMSFAYPAVLLMPFALWFLRAVRKVKAPAATYPQIQVLKAARPTLRQRLRAVILPPLMIGFVALLSIAAARPQRVSTLPQHEESRNIMLVIDVSPSMGARDIVPGGAGRSRRSALTRLAAVKTVISEFIKARQGDSLGLVVFGGTAYLQAPLTFDHELIQQLINRLEIGMAGDGTAMGDALGIALKRIDNQSARSQAIVLLTDGVSNAGQVNPIKAAKVARDLGAVIHTIGIGSSQSTIVTLPGGRFASQVRAQAEYDEETLKEIAALTGGVFFNAESLEGLSEVYKAIDKLERRAEKDRYRRVVEELSVPYAAMALVCFLLYVLFSNTIFRKVP